MNILIAWNLANLTFEMGNPIGNENAWALRCPPDPLNRSPSNTDYLWCDVMRHRDSATWRHSLKQGFQPLEKSWKPWKLKKLFQTWKNHGFWKKPQKPGKTMEFKKHQPGKILLVIWNSVEPIFSARCTHILSICNTDTCICTFYCCSLIFPSISIMYQYMD